MGGVGYVAPYEISGGELSVGYVAPYQISGGELSGGGGIVRGEMLWTR